MDWVQAISQGLSTIVGGALVIGADIWRTKHEIGSRRGDSLARAYTDFLVSFHTALELNEQFWSGVGHEESGDGPFRESEEASTRRFRAESSFRNALWAVRLWERNKQQQDRLEAVARAFHFEQFDEPRDYGNIASSYPAHAQQLIAQVAAIVDGFQRLHGKDIGLS